mmetsp:Transcript_42415/g.70529  ORF Transcript_42415/g.70529 Transcript_42415/m.70529 type:complete len:358 (-) Transcript_42415:322-1395(-)|eukprot:CAMPEP_0119335316 /NCGR_PEP_ID=MMETSP1333-20130426/89306_1 /TAXON_ID=418940 /ORGANISM="Scyphosphaera apsteinii, Strain RCC1455" /LENGTH=357 /DNA_ID=CAMNT_0007345831 /DNA_START=102 /DNA_END=1175 /DNA_ORIENTATION=+
MRIENLGLLSSDSEPNDLSFHCEERPKSFARTAALLAVPVLWGTYTPSMKLLLESGPDWKTPPALLVNLMSHTVGSIALCLLLVIERRSRRNDNDYNARRTFWASCELGVYLFFGQLTQLLGLQGTSATANAILVQSSVIIVPLFDMSTTSDTSRLFAMVLRLVPSVLALFGVILLTSTPTSEATLPPDSRLGVVFSLMSAACYAMHTLRLSAYSDVDASAQAAGQVMANTVLDMLALPLSASSRTWVFTVGLTAIRRLGLAATWNGLMVVGATTWAMSYAQQAYSPSAAALAYAMEPVFAAAFAVMALGELLGPLQLVGGALVILSNVLAAFVSDKALSLMSKQFDAAVDTDASST